MPALTIPSPTGGESAGGLASTSSPSAATTLLPDKQEEKPAEDSPTRPPESPLTPKGSPKASFAELPRLQVPERPQPSFIRTETNFMDHPQPVPISESTEPDVLALRSTIALLQMQRERSRKDIQSLETIKQAAIEEPVAFIKELREGRLKPKATGILGPTLGDDSDDEAEDEEMKEAAEQASVKNGAAKSRFGPIPRPQNVVRTPPINWDKYSVVGESLDRLHEEQRQRPNFGSGNHRPGGRAPVHKIAAPWDPFTDGVATPTQRKTSKKLP